MIRLRWWLWHLGRGEAIGLSRVQEVVFVFGYLFWLLFYWCLFIILSMWTLAFSSFVGSVPSLSSYLGGVVDLVWSIVARLLDL